MAGCGVRYLPGTVTCANCGTVNPADGRFCIECGSPLASTCPVCGSAVAPGANLCGSCGTRATSLVDRLDGLEGMTPTPSALREPPTGVTAAPRQEQAREHSM